MKDPYSCSMPLVFEQVHDITIPNSTRDLNFHAGPEVDDSVMQSFSGESLVLIRIRNVVSSFENGRGHHLNDAKCTQA